MNEEIKAESTRNIDPGQEKFSAGPYIARVIKHADPYYLGGLEVELLKIARVLGFKINELRKQISLRRLERRKKIGYVHWFKMLFCWKFLSNFEKNKWNF